MPSRFGSSGDGKTLPNSRKREKIHASVNSVAVSCECGRTAFPGAEYDLSTQKRVGKQLRFPTLFLCSAGVVASRRTRLCLRFFRACEDKLSSLGPAPVPAGALPPSPRGLCPSTPPRADRALGWAECASRFPSTPNHQKRSPPRDSFFLMPLSCTHRRQNPPQWVSRCLLLPR